MSDVNEAESALTLSPRMTMDPGPLQGASAARGPRLRRRWLLPLPGGPFDSFRTGAVPLPAEGASGLVVVELDVLDPARVVDRRRVRVPALLAYVLKFYLRHRR